MTPASTFTRLLPALLATAALSGCAVYPAPGYGPYESYGAYGQPYGVSTSPGLVSGSVIYAQPVGGGGYYGNGNGYGYGAGYGRGYERGRGESHRQGWGRGERGGDGIPDRTDRERDGVRNGRDGQPNNRDRR